MSENLALSLQLKLQDRLSAGIKRALRDIQGETKNLKRDFEGVAKAANSIKPNAIERMTKALREAKNTARSTLDIINRTARAGASAAAGAYVVKRALDKPMAYDRQLALTANVAYSDRNVAGRLAGKAELDRAVRNAQNLGLGSQEEVLQTLNDLIGSGAMGEGRAGVTSSIKLLPTILRATTGSGADATDIAKIVMAGKQNMGMTDDEVKRFLSKSIVAANLGGFELKDMARYLPEQMASASANGMKGMRGAEDLLAYNQVARITAGNPDQAGNNLVNLLNKINSYDTQRDFKKQGIDLTGSLVSARKNGIGGLDAFLALVDKVASKDPQYKKLQAQLATEQGTSKQSTLNAMMDIMEQKGLGSVVQDRQAMAALLAARQQSAKLKQVRNAVQADDGTQVDKNYQLVNATASASAERLANAKDAVATASLSAIDGPLKAMLKGIVSVSAAHPVLAAAAYSAATALGAVAAAAGVGALFKGGVPKIPGTGLLKAGGRGLFAAGGAVLGSGAALSAASIGAAGFLGYAVGNKINKEFIDGTKLGNVIGESIAKVLATFGNENAQRALNVNVSLDGQQIAANSEKHYGRLASRK